MQSKQLSATEVTRAHLGRLDAANPALNAVVDPCHEEAMQAAEALDAAIARGQEPGMLCGVPLTIKVNVDQRGYATTNGLRLQEHLMALEDSPVVSNVRKAGAVIIGRTNTPAFSLRWFTKNSLHGQTLNPRNPEITPGGSSGGAAAAVAAGIGAIAHGTDIAGSIRYPAFACGVHGLRPSLGRVSAYNASAPDRFIGAQLMAVSGPIARSIADLELALSAMAFPDPRDPWQVPIPLKRKAFPKRVALALAPDGMPVSADVRRALMEAADALRAAGWTVEERDCPPMRRAAEINARLWMADTQFGVGDMIAREGDRDAEFVFAQMLRDAGDVGVESLMTALQDRVGLMRQWELFFKEYALLLCPVSGELPFDQQRDVRSEEEFAQVFEAQLTQRALPVIGVPALSLATGEVGGRPVGVQLVSGRFREDVLLSAGEDLEAAFGAPSVASSG